MEGFGSLSKKGRAETISHLFTLKPTWSGICQESKRSETATRFVCHQRADDNKTIGMENLSNYMYPPVPGGKPAINDKQNATDTS